MENKNGSHQLSCAREEPVVRQAKLRAPVWVEVGNNAGWCGFHAPGHSHTGVSVSRPLEGGHRTPQAAQTHTHPGDHFQLRLLLCSCHLSTLRTSHRSGTLVRTQPHPDEQLIRSFLCLWHP